MPGLIKQPVKTQVLWCWELMVMKSNPFSNLCFNIQKNAAFTWSVMCQAEINKPKKAATRRFALPLCSLNTSTLQLWLNWSFFLVMFWFMSRQQTILALTWPSMMQRLTSTQVSISLYWFIMGRMVSMLLCSTRSDLFPTRMRGTLGTGF